MAARRVYVVDGARTPFLKAKKGLGPFTGSDLAVAAGRPLLARQPFDATAFDCCAASRRWMLTGMSRSAAVAQKGSSSGLRLSPPDGHAEIATPRYPSFFARFSSETEVSMPTFGIWKMPMRRSGSGAQKPSFSQRL